MKRALTLALAALMLVSVLAVSVFAADTQTFSKTDPKGPGTLVFTGKCDQKSVVYTGTVVNLKEGGSSFCVKANQSCGWKFKVEKAGTYTVVLEYVARTGVQRAINYGVDITDGTKGVFVNLQLCDNDQDHRFLSITTELKAGEHTFIIFPATGFDDSKIKACDIYGSKIYLTKEAVATTTAAATTKAAATTAAKAAATAAAKTADASVVIASVVVAAAAAAVVLKARKH